MKRFGREIKKAAYNFWKDEEAQGMLEYILIAVAVVAAVTVGGQKIREIVSNKADGLGNAVDGVQVDSF